jgi:hypothetical protein
MTSNCSLCLQHAISHAIEFHRAHSPLFQSAPATASLDWEQRGPAIVGNAKFDQLGYLTALSTNARAMAVGAPWYDSYKGYVEVYHTVDDGVNWTQLGQIIYGNATYDTFGLSVDISADGKTIICGSPGYWDGSFPGYVRVYKLASNGDIGTDTWKQIGQDITGEANGDGFGHSVSISGDGKMIAVGVIYNDGMNGEGSGRVRMYQQDGDRMSWEQIGDDIDGDAAGDGLGTSVSLSGNGKTVVMGAPNAGYNVLRAGQVKVYRIDTAGSSWEQLGESIYGDYVQDLFGGSVDISHDGNTIVIGSPSDYGHNNPGYVRVFSLDGSENNIGTGAWNQVGQDITGEAVDDQFGTSVSISDDGKTIAAGAPYNNGKKGDDTGHVRVYRMYHSWMQLGEDIEGEGHDDFSGRSVSLSGDGDTVAIGSPGFSYDKGAYNGEVRVFVVE